MKTRLIKYSLLTAVLLAVNLSIAQPPPDSFENGPMREKVRDRIRTMKIWKLTEAVGLTTEQSEKFFPIYNKYQQKIDAIMHDRDRLLDKLEMLTNQNGASDKDVLDAMAQLKDIPDQMTVERERFLKEVTPILSLNQQAKLMVFEERFMQRLQEFVRDIRHQPGGGGFKDDDMDRK
jgi:hypothetical protein